MPRMAARDYRRTGRIDNMVKDLNGAADLARLTHTPMPLTALCAEIDASGRRIWVSAEYRPSRATVHGLTWLHALKGRARPIGA